MSDKKHTILIVEDEVDQIDPIRSYFTRRGFEVIHTTDQEKALTIIKEKNPDIVLLDLTIDSPLSGRAMLQDLRSYDKNTKVIVLTGNQLIEDKDVESIRSLGISEFFYKPIVLEDLENIIKKLLGIEHALSASRQAEKPKVSIQSVSLRGFVHDLLGSLGVIRNKSENFTMNVKDGLYKDKSDKELFDMALKIMKDTQREIDSAVDIVRKISEKHYK